MRQALVVAMLFQPCFFLIGGAAFAQAETPQADTSQPAAGSLVTDVASLETSVFGQPTSDALAARVEHLELTTLGNAQTGALRARVDSLQKLIQKPEPANQLKGGVAEDTSLHLDPAIENKLPTPFKTETAVSTPNVGPGFLQADSQYIQHPNYRGARRLGRDLGVALGTTLKAAAVLAGAALTASASSTAYSGSALPPSSNGYIGSAFNPNAASELGMHRDLCACHYYHHH